MIKTALLLALMAGLAGPRAAALEPGLDGPIHADHGQTAHMNITRTAYLMYVSQYEGGELSQYIGDYSGDLPDSQAEDTVVEGAYEADVPYKNPFNEQYPWFAHFWDCRQGAAGKGLFGRHAAADLAQKFLTGGYGLNGVYDWNWQGDGAPGRGAKGLGITGLYKSGDKAKAYYYLGHAAHLLEDMTVPAHTLMWPHPIKNADAYETFMTTHHSEWANVPAEPIESFDALYDIFLRTADVTNDFDAGSGAGPLRGRDGEADRGSRREGGFTEAELREEGDVLMPLAYRRVAALFLFFYKQVDKAPPHVTLDAPRVEGSHALLRARAQDDVSGVARRGYRFAYAVWSGEAWSAWRDAAPGPTSSELAFEVLPGARYEFRVTAVDGAGNRGVSEIRRLSVEPAGTPVASN